MSFPRESRRDNTIPEVYLRTSQWVLNFSFDLIPGMSGTWGFMNTTLNRRLVDKKGLLDTLYRESSGTLFVNPPCKVVSSTLSVRIVDGSDKLLSESPTLCSSTSHNNQMGIPRMNFTS